MRRWRWAVDVPWLVVLLMVLALSIAVPHWVPNLALAADLGFALAFFGLTVYVVRRLM